jgi:hypothetical protein
MNIKKIAFLLLSFSVAAFAGKVITYTASSDVSQEQANNTAIAGVAKQVSSQVRADDRLSTSDVSAGGKESISQTYTSKKNVSTDVNLKWIKVQPLPKEGKRFRATATLDVDEMTNNIRLQMADIKNKIAKLESDGRAALDASRYDEAVRCLTNAQALLQPYADLKAELAEVFTLNESFNLKHDLPGFKALIASRLGNVRVETSPSEIVVESDVIKDLAVKVLDAKGPVTDFPLKAIQESKKLDSRRTQDNGSAVFTLQGVSTATGSQSVSFVPDFPRDILKAAGLEKGFPVLYSVKRAACNVRLDCKGNADACKALESELAKNAIYNGKDSRYPQLKAEVASTPKGALGKLVSFDMTVSVTGDRVNFSKSTKGVGKTEAEAMGKGIAKLKFKELLEQVKNICAE